MATITKDDTTKGLFRTRWTDEAGEHEEYFETHAEAQEKVNLEMAFKTAQIENAQKPKNELQLVIQEGELEPTKSQYILEKFTAFFEQAKEWEAKARAIVITDESEVGKMQEARAIRLELKDIRVNADKVRKELKEQSLREGKAIDGVANVIKALIVPIEDYLEKQENFAEVMAEEKKRRIEAERIAALQPFVPDTAMYNLKEMSEEGFVNLLSASKIAHASQKEAEKNAEDERIAKEKAKAEEDERMRKENETLKAEKEVKQKELDEAKKKADEEAAGRKKAEDELAEKQRAEKERIEEEERKKREAEFAKQHEVAVPATGHHSFPLKYEDLEILYDEVEREYADYVAACDQDEPKKPSAYGFKEYLLSGIADEMKRQGHGK